MKILLLDNYDSFTYNLVHLIEKSGQHTVEVFRNDEISLEQVSGYQKIMLSPGPGLPKDAGIMPEVIKHFGNTKSIMGVCLGMQGIGEMYGSGLKNLKTVYHGIARPVNIVDKHYLFNNCPKRFNAGRYHSWVIDPEKISNALCITATDDEGNIMAIKHRDFDVCGVQFHPESILSEYGETIINNWLNN